MGEADGSLEEDLRVTLGLITDDLREELRSGVRRLFEALIESVGTPPPIVPAPSTDKFEEAKDVTPSPPLKLESSTE